MYSNIMKITRKYILIFTLVLIVPTIAINHGIIQYAKHVMQSNIVRQNEAIAELIVKRLNRELSDAVLQLRLIAGLDDGERLRTPIMYSRAKQAISNSTIIQSIYYLDPERRVVFEAPFQPVVEGVEYDYPKFEHVRWSYTYVVSGLVPNMRDEQVVTVAIPVFYEDRRLQGVLVAELSRNYLADILSTADPSGAGFGFLIDQDGRVIASTDESDWSRDFSRETVVRRLLAGDSGSVVEPYRGNPSIMTYQTMRENWGLAVGTPESVAFAPVQTISRALTFSNAGFFVLSLFMILLGMRQILLPIQRLTRYVQRFRGDATLQPLPTPLLAHRDEIGDLSRTFAEMAARIERNQRFLEDIIEGIPYALIALNGEGVVTRVNGKWVELFGRSRDAWEGRRREELPDVPFLSLDSARELLWEDERGFKRALRLVTAPFHDGMLAIAQDITQMKALEAHVDQSEKLALVGQITTGIAHELKNPLAVLASSSQLLRDEIRADQSSEWVPTLAQDIDEEIRRMIQIVNEFLSFARTKQEDVVPIEPARLADRVLHLLRIKMNEAGVQVRRAYEPSAPWIVGKPNKLMQVLLNLLLNSVESMPNGGVVEIRIYGEGGETVIAVRDEGSGISEAQLAWLFNPFYSSKTNGNGLGLTIARDIVQEHGGRLVVHSRLEEGTTVECRFPASPIQEEGNP